MNVVSLSLKIYYHTVLTFSLKGSILQLLFGISELPAPPPLPLGALEHCETRTAGLVTEIASD